MNATCGTVRVRLSALGLMVLLMLAPTAPARAAGPLGEKDLIKIIALDLGDDALVAKIAKDGVAFTVDDAAIARLKAANASEAVLDAVRKAGAKAASVPNAPMAITYDDVLSLLKLEIPEDQILKRLERSPTAFVLDAAQFDALRKAGATDKLLAAMQGTRKPAGAVSEVTDIAVILDCSASMTEATPEGGSKMDAAKRVVTDLVNKIPDGLGLTFLVYGHDRDRKCDAVQVVRPLGPIDAAGKSALAATIARLQPVGATPIGLSLRSAGAELARARGPRGLVLITDGKETCNGSPAAEAAALARAGNLAFGVNVIGFDVNADERAGLEEIARSGNGKYFNADTAAELRGVIETVNKTIAVAAKPAPVQSVRVSRNLRTIKILPPAVEMPPMKEFFVMPGGAAAPFFGIPAVASGTKYGVEVRIPLGIGPPTVDVYWRPEAGTYVPLARGVNFDEIGAVEIRPEEKLGMIQVAGAGLPAAEWVRILPAGTSADAFLPDTIQESAGFGKVMVVPAGRYQVRFKPTNGEREILADKIEVVAGKLTKVE